MNAKEFVSDLSLSVKEKIKSRFFFSLIVLWLIFNWRALSVFLFSSKSIEARIKAIDDDFSFILYTSILPIVLSIAFTILFPYLTALIDKWTKKAKINRHKTLSEIEIDRINQQIKIEGKNRELEDAKTGYREKEDLRQKIKVLSDAVESRNETINMLNEELDKKIHKFNEFTHSTINKEKILKQTINDYIDIKNDENLLKLFVHVANKSENSDEKGVYKKDDFYNSNLDAFSFLEFIGVFKVVNVYGKGRKVTLSEKGDNVWALHKNLSK